MQVNYYGFQFEVSGDLNILDTIMFHEASSPVLYDGLSYPRYVYLDSKSSSNYIVGVIVTEKDKSSSLTLDKKTMTLTRESLDNDETEVNYFLISKINGLGIYQHYHNSTSVRQFNEILECLVFKRKMAVLAKKTKDLNDDKEKKLRKKFKVEVNFSAIYERGGLKKVLEEFDRIKSFQYTFAELEDDVRANVPASTFAYRKTECVVYGDGPVADIGRAIDTFVKNRSLRGGKIKVLNASNRLKTVDIFDNMINFGEQEYDGFLTKIHKRKAAALQGNPIITELINAANNDKQKRFTAKIKN